MLKSLKKIREFISKIPQKEIIFPVYFHVYYSWLIIADVSAPSPRLRTLTVREERENRRILREVKKQKGASKKLGLSAEFRRGRNASLAAECIRSPTWRES